MTNREKQEDSYYGRLRSQILSFFRSDFFSYRHTRRPLAWALLINIILWAAAIIKTHLEVRPIPLHFSAGYGIELVGPAFWLAELPLIGLLLLIANTILAKKLFTHQPFLGFFLNYTSLLIQLTFALALVTIIRLNY